MKKNSSNIAFIICFALCLVFSACGQANSTPASSTEPTPSSTPVPTPTPTPTPKVVDYEALAARLNSDIDSPPDETETSVEAENAGSTEDAATGTGTDSETLANPVQTGGVFEAGEECVIYRFWSAGIDRTLFDLLGNDGTESSAAVYTELLKTFVANYDALQKAVALYEPDAKLTLHVVENSESTDPIIVVEGGEVTYDYASEMGYFEPAEASAEASEAVEEIPSAESTG